MSDYIEAEEFGVKIRVFKNGNIYKHGREITDSLGRKRYIPGYYPAQVTTTFGYKQVSILDDNHVCHRIHVHDLVAKYYCENPKSLKEVHHIDGNKENNDYRNLMWCTRKFNMDEMIKFYNKNKEKFYCKDCGKTISYGATYCSNCVNKHCKNKVDSPMSDTLISKVLLINNGNFTKSAKEFGITDNALRKRCKKLGLPYSSRDYRL